MPSSLSRWSSTRCRRTWYDDQLGLTSIARCPRSWLLSPCHVLTPSPFPSLVARLFGFLALQIPLSSESVPDTHSAVRWATKWHTGGEQWLGIPRVRSPEGWSGWGTAVTPLGLGVACAWTQPPVTAQLPRPLKISVRHMPAHLRSNCTQHTLALHSDTPQATRSTARRVSQECLTRVLCVAVSRSASTSPTNLPGL